MGLVPGGGAPLCTTITLDFAVPGTGRNPEGP